MRFMCYVAYLFLSLVMLHVFTEMWEQQKGKTEAQPTPFFLSSCMREGGCGKIETRQENMNVTNDMLQTEKCVFDSVGKNGAKTCNVRETLPLRPRLF